MSSRRSRSGGELNLYRIEAEEEVFTKPSGRHRRAKIGIRRGRMRTSTRRVLDEPTRSNSPVCSTRSSFACCDSERFATSSRKSVLPSASSKRPTRSVFASVKAPLLWTHYDQNEPSHSEIKRHRQLWPADAALQFHDHPENGETPNEAKDRPTQGTAERTKREGRIRARDEKKNRGVIDDLQNAFEPRLWPRVVKRRAEIEQQHRRHEDARAHQKRGACMRRCGNQQEWGGDERGR